MLVRWMHLFYYLNVLIYKVYASADKMKCGKVIKIPIHPSPETYLLVLFAMFTNPHIKIILKAHNLKTLMFGFFSS